LRRDEIEPPALSPQHDSIDVIVLAGGRGTRPAPARLLRSPIRPSGSPDFWLDIGRREDYELAQDRFGELRGELLPEEGGV
jgi:hypothetical protein